MILKKIIKVFKCDFKERFATFETAKGLYLVPAGVAITYAAIFHVSFVIQVTFAAGGIYAIFEGLRKITVNRVKQALAHEQMKQSRIVDSRAPTTVVKALKEAQ